MKTDENERKATTAERSVRKVRDEERRLSIAVHKALGYISVVAEGNE